MGFRRNIEITLTTEISILIVSLTIGIMISRILGPERRGIYTLLLLLPHMAIKFGTLGIDIANVYFIGKEKFKLEDIKANSLTLSWVISFIAICILVLYNQYVGFDEINRVDPRYFYLALPLIPLAILNVLLRSILLGLNKIGRFNCANAIKPVLAISLLCLLYLIYDIDIFTAVMIQIISGMGAIGFILFNVKPEIKLNFNTKLFRESVNYGVKGYTANLMTFLNYRLDMFLIMYLLSMKELGYYSISVMIAEQLSFVSVASAIVLFPRVSSQKANEENITPVVCRVNFLITLLGGGCLALIAKPGISWAFTESFSPAVIPLCYLIPGVVALSISKILASDLSGRGKIHYSMYISSVALVCNIILNIVLIPQYGISGAAVASSVTYVLNSVLFIYYYRINVRVRTRDVLWVSKADLEAAKKSLRAILH